MPDAFTQAIHDYALESDDNLIILVHAARSFNELHKTLISSFSKKLAEKLKEKFRMVGGWKVNAESLINNPLETYSGLSITHESWPQTLCVLIETSNSCKVHWYGIAWKPELADPTISQGIFNKMNEKIRTGARHKWWPWCIRNNKFIDWSQEEALASMRQVIKGESPAEILDFFYNELVLIVENLNSYLADLPAPIR